MSRVSLVGRKALVTGSGGRVGSVIARALAEAGCDVAIHYASSAKGADEVARHVRSLGRAAITLQADLTKRDEIDRLAKETHAWCGGELSVLVNSAASFERVAPADLDARAWDAAMALNVTAPYLLTLGLRDALVAARGAMIAIACISAERPWKMYLPYSVSKAALVHLVKGLALALAPNVRVNAVAPGTVLAPASYDAAKLAKLREAIPLKRLGAPEDVARAVVFLAENDFVSGEVVAVDGGRRLA